MSDKINVCYINAVSWIAGIERSLIEVMKEIDREKISPVVILPGPGPLADELVKTGVTVEIVPFYGLRARNPLRFLQTVRGINRVVAKHNIDIVYAKHQYVANLAVISGKMSGKKIVTHCHGIHEERFNRWFEKSDFLITTTDSMYEHLRLKGLKAKLAHETVYPGVALTTASDEAKKYVAPEHDGRVVGYVGQLVPEKGMLDLVRAAPKIVRECPDVCFHIIGANTKPELHFTEDIQKEMDRLDVAQKFTVLDFQEDVAGVMRSFDVGVAPSWEEPFGRVVVEYMLAGTPVVGTDAGGIREIITDGVNGFLVTPRDPDSIALATVAALDIADEKKSEIVRNGHENAKRFSVEEHTRRIENILERVYAG